MKVLRFACLVLALLTLASVFVACGNTANTTETGTEKNGRTESTTESATESVTESETEDPLETAYCYYEDEDLNYVCFDSLEACIEEAPADAQIYVLGDFAPEEALTPDPDKHLVILFPAMMVFEPDFTAGVICETVMEGVSRYIYFETPEDILTKDVEGVKPHNGIFWNFHETAELATGRYVITNLNAADEMLDPDYVWNKTHEIDMFGVPYVFQAPNGAYFYDAVSALSQSVIGNTCQAHFINDCYDTDLIDVPVGGATAPGYVIGYYWHILLVRWSYGAVYDDCIPEHGYCYYSSLDRLCGVPNLQGTYMYVWSDVEGLYPGKYYMELVTSENNGVEVFNDDGLWTETTIGQYHLTWVDEIWNFAPEWDEIWEQYPGWKAEFPEWLEEHPNALVSGDGEVSLR